MFCVCGKHTYYKCVAWLTQQQHSILYMCRDGIKTTFVFIDFKKDQPCMRECTRVNIHSHFDQEH